MKKSRALSFASWLVWANVVVAASNKAVSDSVQPVLTFVNMHSDFSTAD